MSRYWRPNKGSEESTVSVPLNRRKFHSAVSLDRYYDDRTGENRVALVTCENKILTFLFQSDKKKIAVTIFSLFHSFCLFLLVGNVCNDIMVRVPYATLIATIMCCLGVGIFCGTMYRGVTLASLMLDQVIIYGIKVFFSSLKKFNI